MSTITIIQDASGPKGPRAVDVEITPNTVLGFGPQGEPISALPSPSLLGAETPAGAQVKADQAAAAAVAGLKGMPVIPAVNELITAAASGTFTMEADVDASLSSRTDINQANTGAAYRWVWGVPIPSESYQVVGVSETSGLLAASRIEFCTDATKIQLQVIPRTATVFFRAYVKGAKLGSDVTVVTADGYPYMTLAGLDAGYKTVVVECSGFLAWNHIRVAPPFGITATNPRKKLLVFGDSIGHGKSVEPGEGCSQDGYAFRLSKLLGMDLDNSSVDSTGYTAPVTYASRLADPVFSPALRSAPNLILCQASSNDSGVAETVNTAALAFWQSLRAAFPRTPIVVHGFFGFPALGDVTEREASMAATFSSWGDSNAVFVATRAWYSGTGKFTAPSGTGNNDIYCQDDYHPTKLGHAYHAQRLCNALVSAGLVLA